MKWSIRYSEEARNDIRDIYEYITYVLFAPNAAKNQYSKIIRKISSLENMPERYPLYSVEPWCGLGLRWVAAGNFYIFYFVDKDCGAVNIARVMYKGRGFAL